jgi:predicted nucleic acid-binding protein
VLPQTRAVLQEAIQLYANRLDKGYSLTDCISMITMRGEKLNEVLTDDHHFEQEQCAILIKKVSDE